LTVLTHSFTCHPSFSLSTNSILCYKRHVEYYTYLLTYLLTRFIPATPARSEPQLVIYTPDIRHHLLAVPHSSYTERMKAGVQRVSEKSNPRPVAHTSERDRTSDRRLTTQLSDEQLVRRALRETVRERDSGGYCGLRTAVWMRSRITQNIIIIGTDIMHCLVCNYEL